MKICHVITRMIVGGAQENTLYTLLGHREHGHDATLVTGPSPGPEGKLLQQCRVPDLKIITEPNLVRPLHPIRDIAAYRSLRRLFAKGQYDIVHTHSSKAGIIGRLAATSAGVPVVVHTIHGQAFHPYESWWRNQIYIAAERFAARRCDRIFAVAAAMISQCVDRKVDGCEKYRTIYSGMELEPFADTVPDPELAQRLGLRPGSIVVGKIARLFELKGYEFLLQAAPKIIAAAPDMQFLIVGDGDLRPALEAEVRRLGMTEHFVFAGLVAPAEIPQYTALMDLLVHLSLREGLPRSVVQAQAAGKPVVGFDLDGTPEIIQDGETGFLCPAENVDAVADGVVRLLKDGDLRQRLGAAGQERARQWDWRAMVDAIETEYTQLLAAKQSSPTP